MEVPTVTVTSELVEGQLFSNPWLEIGTIVEVRGGKRLTITG